MWCNKKICLGCLFLGGFLSLLGAPRVSLAYWYAVDWVDANGVNNPDNALDTNDNVAADLLYYGSYIVLYYDYRFGDVCGGYDILLYTHRSDQHIGIELSDNNSVFHSADWIKYGNRFLADMGGWGCFNIGKRWQFIRITNLDPENVIELDAVASVVPPASSSLALPQEYPFPEDRCDCGAPLLSDLGLAILVVILVLVAVIALKHKQRLLAR